MLTRRSSLPRSLFTTKKPKRAGRPAWKCAEDYRRWLRKLPCACCGHVGSGGNPIIAAHVDHAGGKGAGTKVADQYSLPLCDSCHTQQHAIGWRTFEMRLPGQDAVALTSVFWNEWPGMRDWERDLAAQAAAAVPA